MKITSLRKVARFYPLFAVIILPTIAVAKGPIDVMVHLNEFSVKVNRDSFPSGSVRFIVANEGLEAHEFVISQEVNGHFEELKEIEPFPPGVTKEMILVLSPGRYELSCQIVEKESGGTVEHFNKGMRTEIIME